jgi:hypothetical protein
LGQAVEQAVAGQVEDRAERVCQVVAGQQRIVDAAGDPQWTDLYPSIATGILG